MLRAVLFLLALVAGPLAASAAEPTKLRMGIEGAYPPFSEKVKGGAFKGFDVDIANALCNQLKAKCTLVQRDWDGIQDALLHNEVDAIVASMSITAERKQRFAFTDKYYHTAARFVGRQGAGLKLDAADLAGKRIAVQQNTVHDRYMTRLWGNVVQIDRFKTLPLATKALAAGQVDMVLADGLALATSFVDTPGGKSFAFTGPALTDPAFFGEGIGIAVRKQDIGLKKELDGALRRIRQDGTYKALVARYFTFDIDG
jgi:arginine/ornithine transport system substrate-binding protein